VKVLKSFRFAFYSTNCNVHGHWAQEMVITIAAGRPSLISYASLLLAYKGSLETQCPKLPILCTDSFFFLDCQEKLEDDDR
jgi:hypothetical protein